jgi:hypothetical protein
LLELPVVQDRHMVPDFGLHQRVALVTGCTSPLGSSIARMLANHGAWIALNYFADNRAAKSLLDTIRSEGGRAMLAAGSVRDAEGVWKVARYVEAEWAQIDILVHVASLLTGAEYIDNPAPLLAELLPGMQERQWGRIVIFGTQYKRGEPFAEPLSNNVVIHRVNLASGVDDEALARLTVFLASEWEMCLT